MQCSLAHTRGKGYLVGPCQGAPLGNHMTDFGGRRGVRIWRRGEADRLEQSHEGREVRGRTGRDTSRPAGVSVLFIKVTW